MKRDPQRSDWLAYKRLNRLRGAGLALSSVANNRLAELQEKYPRWSLDGSERDEFAIWSQTSAGSDPDTTDFSGLDIEKILPAIRESSAKARFDQGDTWRAYTKAEPDQAFAAIVASFRQGNVQEVDEWRQLFWTLREVKDNGPLQSEVANWLIDSDVGYLCQALEAVANWLQGTSGELVSLDGNAKRVLLIWDKVAAQIPSARENPIEYHNDLMGAVLNSAAGVLPDLLIEQISRKGASKKELATFRKKLAEAITWPGEHGVVAQASLLQRLPYLETKFPTWVRRELAPCLNIRDNYWLERWNARFYHQNPGSRELFARTKQAFLETFEFTSEIANHEFQTLILLNASLTAIADKEWPLSPSEAKQALLRGGESSLADVCWILRHRNTKSEASAHWREVVWPVLKFAWPLDEAARSKRVTNGLLQLIFESGSEFGVAANELRNFLTADWGGQSWGIDDLLEGETLENALKFPAALLDILIIIVDRENPSTRLNLVLDKIAAAESGLAHKSSFKRLRGFARKAAS